MFLLPTQVRYQFVGFAADVIEQHQSKMTDIDFHELINEEEGNLSEAETRLAEALINSG